MRMPATADNLVTLREYRKLAPWNLRDLSAVAGALLETSGIRPISGAAAVKPNARTIRYYVTRGLVAPPSGRGAAATYSYRHLLQVLSIKLRQMDGASLEAIARELPEQTGDAIERQVAAALGPNLPEPAKLSLRHPESTRGRSARALHSYHALAQDQETDQTEGGHHFTVTKWHRVPIVRGLELHVHEGHPLASRAHQTRAIADAVRRAVSQILSEPE